MSAGITWDYDRVLTKASTTAFLAYFECTSKRRCRPIGIGRSQNRQRIVRQVGMSRIVLGIVLGRGDDVGAESPYLEEGYPIRSRSLDVRQLGQSSRSHWKPTL